MMEASMGVDVGSISTKGVIIDSANNILASEYIWTEGDPVSAVQRVLTSLRSRLRGAEVLTVGTTGSARRLAGAMLDADAVKNEITAHATGTLTRQPQARTIIEIGGQDSKIILLDDGIVKDYAMNTLCAAGTGAFLSSQAKRLGLAIEDLGDMAMRSNNPTKIAARCTVFAESDMIHKAQAGHSKVDLVAGLCAAVASNYLNNVGKGKRIMPPVVFQGGVSKNKGVIEAFKRELREDIFVDEDSHLMGAVGAAALSRVKPRRQTAFDFAPADVEFSMDVHECEGCPNNCEIIRFYRDGALIDTWGSKCGGQNMHSQSAMR